MNFLEKFASWNITEFYIILFYVEINQKNHQWKPFIFFRIVKLKYALILLYNDDK